MDLQMRVQVGVDGIGSSFGCKSGKRDSVGIEILQEQIGSFGQVLFVGGLGLFGFGSLGELFHKVTLSVTTHYGFVFIFAQLGSDVVVIPDVLKHRKHGLEQKEKADQYYDFIHVANLSNKILSIIVKLQLKKF